VVFTGIFGMVSPWGRVRGGLGDREFWEDGNFREVSRRSRKISLMYPFCRNAAGRMGWTRLVTGYHQANESEKENRLE
jgi:hypothetical protein